MIALLRGEVAVRRADHVVVLCGSVGYRAAVSAETLRHVPAGRRGGDAAHPPDRARRRARALRLPLRAGARPVPDAARRAGGRPEGRAGGALGGPAARADRGARGRRRGALPGGARGSASAPPSGSSSSCARRSASTAARTRRARADRGAARRGAQHPRVLAREGLLELGYAPAEAEELLRDAEGESAEELIGHALRLARARREAMSETAGPHPDALPGRRGRARPLAAPAPPGGVRRPGDAARAARGGDRGVHAPAARRSTTCCSPARRGSARPRSRRSSPRELDVPFVQTAGPGARAQGRHRGVPDRARAAQRVLRR